MIDCTGDGRRLGVVGTACDVCARTQSNTLQPARRAIHYSLYAQQYSTARTQSNTLQPARRAIHYSRLSSRLQCVKTTYSPFGCDAVYQHFGETSCHHLQRRGNFETKVCNGGLLGSRMRQVRSVRLAM